MTPSKVGTRAHSPWVRDRILQALQEELADRVREVGFKQAVSTLRQDVLDGLAPGATLADVTAIIAAYGDGRQTNT